MKTFTFLEKLGMWCLKWIVLENKPCCEDFNTHLWGFWGDRLENVHFESKLRHVTPQIDCLRKRALLWGCKHTFLGFKEIDGKMFIFWVKLGMWCLKSIISENEHFLRVSTHIFGVSQEIDGKTFIFKVNIDMWALKSIDLKNEHCSDVWTHMYGVSEEIDGKTFIFRVNLGMWPLKSIISEKQALFWGFQHTFMGFLRR